MNTDFTQLLSHPQCKITHLEFYAHKTITVDKIVELVDFAPQMKWITCLKCPLINAADSVVFDEKFQHRVQFEVGVEKPFDYEW